MNIKMTLKNYGNGLSQNAKAFSVENLLKLKSSKTKTKFQIKNGVTVELCNSELWEKFNKLGTEMIVTRAGRRMFPTLKFRLHELELSANYIVYLDITLASEVKFRYNFQRTEWIPAGPANIHNTKNIYIHPISPARGCVWMSQENISFDKVKLTNNKKSLMKDHISVYSMHKYQPIIHIVEIPPNIQSLNCHNFFEYTKNNEKTNTFIFEQASFITVTAYQNQKITHLKIQSNPFAKGFRQSGQAKKKCKQHKIDVCQ